MDPALTGAREIILAIAGRLALLRVVVQLLLCYGWRWPLKDSRCKLTLSAALHGWAGWARLKQRSIMVVVLLSERRPLFSLLMERFSASFLEECH